MAISDIFKKITNEKPAEEIGIGGFVTYARVSDTYSLKSEAPTTYVEDGTAVNDHVIKQPRSVTITGVVTDTFIGRSEIAEKYTRLTAELGNIISQYGSSATQAQLSKVNALVNSAADKYRSIKNAYNTGKQALGFVGILDEEDSIQKQFIDTMNQIYRDSQLIEIEMAAGNMKNMLITSFEASTDNETDQTDFTIEAVEFRTVETEGEWVTIRSEGLNGQADGKKEKGVQSGEDVETSLLGNILSSVR